MDANKTKIKFMTVKFQKNFEAGEKTFQDEKKMTNFVKKLLRQHLKIKKDEIKRYKKMNMDDCIANNIE